MMMKSLRMRLVWRYLTSYSLVAHHRWKICQKDGCESITEEEIYFKQPKEDRNRTQESDLESLSLTPFKIIKELHSY
jgi:hypothetical protein